MIMCCLKLAAGLLFLWCGKVGKNKLSTEKVDKSC